MLGTNAWYSFNLNGNVYYTNIIAFTIENLFPFYSTFAMEEQQAYSGNLKWNNNFKLANNYTIQLAGIYLAPDIIPQGRIVTRFSVDFGLTKIIQNGKGEFFANGSDLFNTLRIKREIMGDGFTLISNDYYPTQMFRVGYNYRF